MELLNVRGLTKHFAISGSFGRAKQVLRAVDGVSFSLNADSVVAIVGESGCGKSTVARLVLRLIAPTSGSVLFKGKDIFSLDKKELKAFRKSAQIIFQDPFASLNPRRTVYDTVSEPLVIHKLAPRAEMRGRVAEILNKVGMGTETMNRYPHEFSGGQRQRICIARALAVSPELIIADEPLSALDVSIQAQILNLLHDLKRTSKIAFLFISHDLRVVRYFSDEVNVMYLGKIVEHAKTEELFSKPYHPYTEVLLASAPQIKKRDGSRVMSDEFKEPSLAAGDTQVTHHPAAGGPAGAGASRITDLGDVPSPVNIPPGCSFHPRCPKRFAPCDKIIPELKERDGRLVSCHLWHSY
ncbi:MAG: ATP-binding cassette domain-containing protein [Nitrospirae bacterium]|nr:ATP-binding cassette domain-containing protein [Nitrospirota bacterium]